MHQHLPWEIVPKNNSPSPRPTRRVALLAIAQRTVQVKYPSNAGNQKRAKVLKFNMKTFGDWLKVKRLEKNLTAFHVAAKMGIATSLVCSWERNASQPTGQQLAVLSKIYGVTPPNLTALTASIFPRVSEKAPAVCRSEIEGQSV